MMVLEKGWRKPLFFCVIVCSCLLTTATTATTTTTTTRENKELIREKLSCVNCGGHKEVVTPKDVKLESIPRIESAPKEFDFKLPTLDDTFPMEKRNDTVCVCKRQGRPAARVKCAKPGKEEHSECIDHVIDSDGVKPSNTGHLSKRDSLSFHTAEPVPGRVFRDEPSPECSDSIDNELGVVFETSRFSASSCRELGWNVLENTRHVCAHSAAEEQTTTTAKGKKSKVGWDESRDNCRFLGARLCTAAEIREGVLGSVGGGGGGGAVWTSTACLSPANNNTQSFIATTTPTQVGTSPGTLTGVKTISVQQEVCVSGAAPAASTLCCADAFQGNFARNNLEQCVFPLWEPTQQYNSSNHNNNNNQTNNNNPKANNNKHKKGVVLNAHNFTNQGEFASEGYYVFAPFSTTSKQKPLQSRESFSIEFEAKGEVDARVLLVKPNNKPAFEIVLCGKVQNQTYVRYGERRVILTHGTSTMCVSNDTFRTFWVRFDGEFLTVGRGDVSSNCPILVARGKTDVARVAVGTAGGGQTLFQNLCVFRDVPHFVVEGAGEENHHRGGGGSGLLEDPPLPSYRSAPFYPNHHAPATEEEIAIEQEMEYSGRRLIPGFPETEPDVSIDCDDMIRESVAAAGARAAALRNRRNYNSTRALRPVANSTKPTATTTTKVNTTTTTASNSNNSTSQNRFPLSRDDRVRVGSVVNSTNTTNNTNSTTNNSTNNTTNNTTNKENNNNNNKDNNKKEEDSEVDTDLKDCLESAEIDMNA